MRPRNHYSIPHLLQIEMTYACNFQCRFCYNPLRNLPIDYDTVWKVVENVSKANIPHVYLMGGEPSVLEHDFVVDAAKKLSKTSAVTVVTNGYLPIAGLPEQLACVGIPLHGTRDTHEHLTCKPGSFERSLAAMRFYREQGHQVRCIPVLTKLNYTELYDIIKIAAQMNCQSVFVDRYEDGGLGSRNAAQLKPNIPEMQEAISQMIKAEKDFDLMVTFGTAVPFCIDPRLRQHRLTKDCGAGITFAAVSPTGDLRICNQSDKVFGNVLEKDVPFIWNSSALNCFRDYSWVNEPCTSCCYISECFCGCKVDASSNTDFTIDYSVRDENLQPYSDFVEEISNPKIVSIPANLRKFAKRPLARINESHKETYIVTRYNTVEIHDDIFELVKSAIEAPFSEEDFITRWKDTHTTMQIRHLLSMLENIGAIQEC